MEVKNQLKCTLQQRKIPRKPLNFRKKEKGLNKADNILPFPITKDHELELWLLINSRFGYEWVKKV